jgi:hypothetical protein
MQNLETSDSHMVFVFVGLVYGLLPVQPKL